jgi:hypothetical protein
MGSTGIAIANHLDRPASRVQEPCHACVRDPGLGDGEHLQTREARQPEQVVVTDGVLAEVQALEADAGADALDRCARPRQAQCAERRQLRENGKIGERVEVGD